MLSSFNYKPEFTQECFGVNNSFTQNSSTPSTYSYSVPDTTPSYLSLANMDLNEQDYLQSTRFCGIKTKRLTHSFHYKFNSLKTEMKIEDTRKTHIDSLLKKVKSKCLKSVHDVIKQSINLIVGRLPQIFITNIKIDFNKYYLNKSIGEIYYEYQLLPSYQEILEKKLIRKGKFHLVNELFTLKLKEVYDIYLESDLFKKDFDKIKEKDGEEIAILYQFVAKNMNEYFLLSRGNKKNAIGFLRNRKDSFMDSNKKTVFTVSSNVSKPSTSQIQ